MFENILSNNDVTLNYYRNQRNGYKDEYHKTKNKAKACFIAKRDKIFLEKGFFSLENLIAASRKKTEVKRLIDPL